MTTGSLSVDELLGLGAVTVNTGISYPIASDGERLVVNGVPLVGTAVRIAGRSTVYPIARTLP
ncbi:hypothetical protein [Ilumatobacter sp.]|uniref:hypothetical protein n=1 Tax=Ilumatobacter sp. TaxID=1967498 RepID=UPI003B51F984